MPEIKRPLATFKGHDDETYYVIGPHHSWSDVLRAVAADLGWDEVQDLVERLKGGDDEQSSRIA